MTNTKDKKMTKEELIKKLKEIQELQESGVFDNEIGHIKVDELLIEYINDEEVKKAYDSISKWYS